jgi:hypothetical protein
MNVYKFKIELSAWFAKTVLSLLEPRGMSTRHTSAGLLRTKH